MNKLNEQLSRTKELMGIINEQKGGDPVEFENLPDWLKEFIEKYNINATYNLVGHSTGGGYEYDKVFGMKMGTMSTDISEEDVNTYEKNKGKQGQCKKMKNRKQELEREHEDIFRKHRENRKFKEREVMELRAKIQKMLNTEYPNMEDICKKMKHIQDIINQ